MGQPPLDALKVFALLKEDGQFFEDGVWTNTDRGMACAAAPPTPPTRACPAPHVLALLSCCAGRRRLGSARTTRGQSTRATGRRPCPPTWPITGSPWATRVRVWVVGSRRLGPRLMGGGRVREALGAGHTPCSEPLLEAALRGEVPHPRPGAVRAPTGGSGHFLALQIPAVAEAHARAGGYGLRWPRSTYAISARSRPGF